MIVVVDSGVWISALQFEGVPLLTIDQILSRHLVAICDPIALEIRTALMKKFGWSRIRPTIATGGASDGNGKMHLALIRAMLKNPRRRRNVG